MSLFSVKLAVWHIPQVPGGAIRFPVASVEEAILVLAVLWHYDLKLYEQDIRPDFSNASGLIDEVTNDEWEDPDGNQITGGAYRQKIIDRMDTMGVLVSG